MSTPNTPLTRNNIPNETHVTNTTSSFRIGSLNCRSIVKSNSPDTRASFIRYLRTLNCDILCLQETHASTESLQKLLNNQFQIYDSIWTSHCGIIIFNPNLCMLPTFITIDQRAISCTISHTQSLFAPTTLINIYAPASYQPRRLFFDSLLKLPQFQLETMYPLIPTDEPIDEQSSSDPQSPGDEYTNTFHLTPPMIILGDFNYHSLSYATDTSNYDDDDFQPPSDNSTDHVAVTVNPQQRWHHLMTRYLTECTHSHDNNFTPSASILPTFRRGTSKSTIDYIYVSPILASHLKESNIEFIKDAWTDHALLSIHLAFTSPNHGPGLWRLNPHMAKNQYFIDQLLIALDDFHSVPSSLSPQDSWDKLKILVKRLAKKINRRYVDYRTRVLKRLQRKRNRLLRTYKLTHIIHDRLSTLESLIGSLQQEIADNHALRAGLRWRENGEKSAGFLKRLIATRTAQRSISSFKHPETQVLCTSVNDLDAATTHFYDQLYTPDNIDLPSVDILRNTISPDSTIPQTSHASLTAVFESTDLISAAQRSPHKSSPGIDGLPYEIVSILFSHSATLTLALQVYNDALLNGIFPSSWLKTCICLLPKKGDLQDLRNWRPISLINTDAKIFTRLLNARLMPIMNKLISPHQLGFMPNRFIGEHGLTATVIQAFAQNIDSPSIGLLLDQEKAYDRIHPEYLQLIMHQFGIPATLITSIINLFFSTQISVNINGNLTSQPITQQRGLRQGDPLSPLLYNIAFDPFLRLIHQNNNFTGFDIQQELQDHDEHSPVDDIADALNNLFLQPSPVTDNDLNHLSHNVSNLSLRHHHEPHPANVKILAYADDTLVFLHSPTDFTILQQAISTYSLASNASLNYHKTEALSLSGKPHPQWQELLASHSISTWHDRSSPSPLRYLGFQLYSNLTQRNFAFTTLLQSLRNICHLYMQRNLSLRGRVTVINTLIFSKLWHVLRLSPLTQAQFQQLRSLASSFINQRIFPKISFDTMILPRQQGGLGLIDPATQQSALQWKWILPLLQSDHTYSSTTAPQQSPSIPLLRYYMQHYYSSPTFPTYHYYLLFQHCRFTHWFPSNNAATSRNSVTLFSSFINTTDFIALSFTQTHINHLTCLSLPFIATVSQFRFSTASTYESNLSVLLKRHPGLNKLLVKDIFFHHTASNTLRLHLNPPPRLTPHRNLILLATRYIRNDNILCFPLLSRLFHSTSTISLSSTPQTLDLSPFINSLLQPNTTTSVNSLIPLSSPKYFKILLSRSTSSANPTFRPTLSSKKWLKLWKLEIPLPSRTIWYRLLHHKIPTRTILHRLFPSSFPNSFCPLCLQTSTSTIEDQTHFLFTCPSKLAIWNLVFKDFLFGDLLPTTLDTASILYLFSTFNHPTYNRPPHLPFPHLDLYQIFACTLQGIWSAHWQFIFHDTPFLPSTIYNRIRQLLTILDSEIQLQQRPQLTSDDGDGEASEDP